MKRVLITGASSGIGKQLAEDYAKEGYHVFACARSSEKLQELSEKSEGKITSIIVDVSEKKDVEVKFANLEDLDLIILNAGTCEYVDVDHFDSSLFARVFKVNFFGVVYSVEFLLSKINKGGKIAIIGSQARLLPFTRSEAYGRSRAAIDYFTKSLSVDLARRDVSVHAVDPGFVKTPLTDKNDFSMPFLISVEEASKSLRRSLEKGELFISFPKSLSRILSLCHLLPARAQRAISLYLKDKS